MAKLTKLQHLLLQGKDIGIFVENTNDAKYAEALCAGIKRLQTRNKNTLGKLCGKTVFVIRTRNGSPSDVIGWVKLGDHPYKASYSVFTNWKVSNLHLVPYGSKYYCKENGYKWLYSIERCGIVDSKSYSYERVNMTYAVITASK